MKRQQTTTLFNQNHVQVLRIDNVQYYSMTREEVSKNKTGTCFYKISSTHSKTVRKKSVKGRKIRDNYVEVTCKSPLGFYYKKKICDNEEVIYANREVVEFEYRYKFTKYIVSFFITYDDNKVIKSEDGLRPWDIVPGDKSFSDRDIENLKSELDKLFSLIESNGCNTVRDGMYPVYWYRPITEKPEMKLKSVKDEIYTDLFGNKNGFRAQTDKEKIEAHGFDFKYSFRKDKEERC